MHAFDFNEMEISQKCEAKCSEYFLQNMQIKKR